MSERFNRDLHFILREMDEVCCMRRTRTGKPEHGFITSGAKRELHFGDVWSGGTGKSYVYESIESMLLDGWCVD